MRRSGVQRIELDVTSIARDYLAGRTADEIAAQWFVCRDTVLRRLDEAGVRKRRRSDYRYRRRHASD